MLTKSVGVVVVALSCAIIAPCARAQMAAPTLYGPTGVISSDSPTYSWEAVRGATLYSLVVYCAANQLMRARFGA